MKVVTWNILASEWIKKSYYPTVKDPSLFKNRIQTILHKIKDMDPDIVCLQEVMPHEYTRLCEAFPQYQCSKLTPIQWYNKKSKSGNLTMVKKRFTRWTEHSFDHGVYVQVDRLHVFNVHLDDVSYTKRLRQLHQLDLSMDHVIVAGDFNQEYKPTALYQLPGFTVHNKCPTYFVEKKMNIDNILTKGIQTKLASNSGAEPRNAVPRKRSRRTRPSCEYVPDRVEEELLLYGSDHIPVTVVL